MSNSPSLAEIVVTLSLATDIGVGMPMEMMLTSCLLSMRLGDALGLTDAEMREAYYLALTRHAGCTADGPHAAELMGNEHDTVRDFFSVHPSQPFHMMNVIWHNIVDQTRPPLERFGLFMRLMSELPQIGVAHCEVAQQLASRLNFDERIQSGLRQFGERWDGKGLPYKLKGEAILLPVRVAQVAHDAVVIHGFFGLEAAINAMRQRAGSTHDPVIVEKFCAHAENLLTVPASLREVVLAAEPGAHHRLNDEQLESVIRAFADFADLQNPFSIGHSTAVASLAEKAARQLRFSNAEVTILRRAGYLHDIGRVGISANIWGKAGALNEADWERVHLHPYFTQRILSQPQALAELGAIASTHHERLDGSGYYRNLSGGMITPPMRLLATAEAYQAMVEERPYRPALSPEQAIQELKRDVRLGRLDGEVVNAVLAAAGQPTPKIRRQHVSDLTERELEILRLVAHGCTNPQIATQLVISRKTVSRHLESIYNKIDVTTRAAATYFAMQHHLI